MTNPPPGSGPPPGGEPGASPSEPGVSASRPPRSFRATLVRVMIVQIVTLVLFWFLQARFDVPG